MADLSIIIPARNERWLQNTIDDVLQNRRGSTECIVILDGSWPVAPLRDHPNCHLIYHSVSVGQREAVNEGVRLSRAKYICKLDAHCSFGEGFDLKLIEPYESGELTRMDTTIPRLINLHVFTWVCSACKAERYQGPEQEVCGTCGAKNTQVRELVWKPRMHKVSDFCRFDHDLHFQYWRSYKHRPEAQGDICDVMGGLGACFFMRRDRFEELGGLDTGHGSWGQMGTEISCKSWLSGGRQVVNKRTHFTHCFRTNSGPGWGFASPVTNADVERAREHSKRLWLDNTWPGQKFPLAWLVEKFAPVPDWSEPQGADRLAHIRKAAETFHQTHPLHVTPIRPSVPAVTVRHETPTVTPKSAVLWYTDNRLDESIGGACRRQLQRAVGALPIYAVSREPQAFGDVRVVLPGKRSELQMFKQIAAGLAAMPADIDTVFFAEHDLLYPPEHFGLSIESPEAYYYDQNNWRVNAETGHGVFYYAFAVSGLFASRALLVDHYAKRIARVEAAGRYERCIGFEPGCHRPPRGIDVYPAMRQMADVPHIDIRHGHNLSLSRWRVEDFRDKRTCLGWTESPSVPGWGVTEGRFMDFLRDVDAQQIERVA